MFYDYEKAMREEDAQNEAKGRSPESANLSSNTPEPPVKVDQENPYLAAMQEEDALGQTALGLSLESAAKTEPDRKAQVLRLSQRADLPPEFVDQHLDEIRAKYDVSDTSETLKASPILMKWLQDPNNAALASDDVEHLRGVEDSWIERNKKNKAWASLMSGLSGMAKQAAQAPALAYEIASLPLNFYDPFDQYQRNLDQAMREAQASGDFGNTFVISPLKEPNYRAPETLRNNAAARYFKAQEESFAAEVPSLGESPVTLALKGDYAKAGEALFYQAIANSPQLALTIGSAFLGAAGKGLAVTGTLVASEKAADNAEKGVDPVTGTATAVAFGAYEAAFEKMGTLRILKEWEKALAKTAGKAGAKEIMLNFFKTFGFSIAQEGTEEALTTVAQEMTDYVTGINENALSDLPIKVADSFLLGGVMGGGIVSPTAVAGVIEQRRRARKAAEDKALYLKNGEASQNSKLNQRMPEAHADFMSQVLADVDVYIPAEAIKRFAQSINENPAVLMEKLGKLSEYETALEQGYDVKVPLSEWTQKTLGTKFYQGLADDVRLEADSQSVNESRLIAEAEAAKVEGQSQRESKARPEPKPRAVARQKIINEVKAVVEELKRSSPEMQITPMQINTFADTILRQLEVRAEDLGLSVEQTYGDIPEFRQLLQQNVFEMQGPEQDVGQRLAQQDERPYNPALKEDYDTRLESFVDSLPKEVLPILAGSADFSNDLGELIDSSYFDGSLSKEQKLEQLFRLAERDFSVPVPDEFSSTIAMLVRAEELRAYLRDYDSDFAKKYLAKDEEFIGKILQIFDDKGIKYKPLNGQEGKYWSTQVGELRITDHSQPKGGGFNLGTGSRFGESNISIVFDLDQTGKISAEMSFKRESIKDAAVYSNLKDSQIADLEESLEAVVEEYQGQSVDFGQSVDEWRKTSTGTRLFQSAAQQLQPVAQPTINPLGFYSQVEAEVLKMNFSSMPAKDLANKIKSSKGVKKEELEWLGLIDWLNTQEGKVSKDEVLNFIRQNGIQLEQVVLAEDFEYDSEANSELPLAADLEWEEEILSATEIDPDGSLRSNNAYENASEDVKYNWDEDYVQSVAKDLKEDFTDENGNVDEKGWKQKVLENLSESYYERETENIDDGDSVYSQWRYTERNTGWYFEGSGDYEYRLFNERGREVANLGSNDEEAKVLALQFMIDDGVVAGRIADTIKREDITWREPTASEYPNQSAITRRANNLIKKERARLEAWVLENEQWRFDEKQTPEERKKTLDEGVEWKAKDEARKYYDNHQNPKNKVTISVKTAGISAELTGNDKKGYELFVYGKKLRSRDGGQGAPIKFQGKLDAANLDEAKAKALDIFEEKGFIAKPQAQDQTADQTTEVVDPNKPSGRAFHYSRGRAIQGGQNYREFLLTLPKFKKFYSNSTHFHGINNYISHTRVQDFVDDKDQKLLVIDEQQNDAQAFAQDYGIKTKEWIAAREQAKKTLDEKQAAFDEAAQESADSWNALKNHLKAYPKVGEYKMPNAGELAEAIIRQGPSAPSVEQDRAREELGAFYDQMISDQTALDLAKKYLAAVEKEAPLQSELNAADEALSHFKERAIDDAPFIKDTEALDTLMMKRMLRLAVEQGYDGMAIVASSVPIQRWGYEEIEWTAKREGDEWVTVSHDQQLKRWTVLPKTQVHGRPMDFYEYADEQSKAEALAKAEARAAELNGPHWVVYSSAKSQSSDLGVNLETDPFKPERIGHRVYTKAEAEKLIEGVLSTRNEQKQKRQIERVWSKMQAGESGKYAPRKEAFETRYDKNLPKITLALAKKFDPDAKVETRYIDTGVDRFRVVRQLGKTVVYDAHKDEFVTQPQGTASDLEALAERLNAENPTGQPVQTLILTDKIKQQVLSQGFPLFQQERGAIFITPTKRFIELGQKADVSTLLHEMSHFWFDQLGKDYELLKNIPEEQRTAGQKRRIKLALDTLKWAGASSFDKITREQHEMFADSFETYAIEGKSPIAILSDAFHQFRIWLTNIYKSVAAMREQLDPEIRNIFDRFLATEEEMAAQVEAMEFKPLLGDSPETMGLGGQKAEQYINVVQDARIKADEIILNSLMEGFRRQRKAVYKEQWKANYDRILSDLSQQRVYRALSILQTGALPGGSELDELPMKIKLSKEILDQFFDPEIVKLLPKGVAIKETQTIGKTLSDDPQFISGLHPDIAAEMLGYKNGAELVFDLARTEKIEEAARRLTDQHMKLVYPDLIDNPDAIRKQAVDAIRNESNAKRIRMELEIIATENLPAFKAMTKQMIKRVPSEAAVKEQAAQILGRFKVKDIKPHLFLRAERRAANDAAEAFVRGDRDAAWEAKRRELLNHELFRAANDALDSVDKGKEFFKKFRDKTEDLAKKRDINIINAGRAVLQQFGLGRADKTANEFVEQIREYDPEAYRTVFNLVETLEGIRGNYLDIPLDAFEQLEITLRSFWDLARSNKEFEINGQKFEREKIFEELRADMAKHAQPEIRAGYTRAVTPWEKTKSNLLGLKATLRRVESWAEVTGPAFVKYIFRPVSESAARYREARKPVLERYLEVVKGVEKSLTSAPINAPELNYTFKDKAELLAALLHTGNGSNKSKLLLGRGWGEIDIDGALVTRKWDAFIQRLQREGVLTKSDYDYAQGVWDLNESLKPEAQKAHKDILGFYFDEITAEEVITPFGVYRGGYVPAVADPDLVQDASSRIEEDELLGNNHGVVSMFPSGGRGFTKGRVQRYTVPLLLDLRLVPSHLDKVLRFIHIEKSVVQTARLFRDFEFRKDFDAFDENALREMIWPWLQRSARQQSAVAAKTKAGRAADRFWSEIRSRTGLQIMMANVGNTIEQVTGFTVAAVKVSPKFLARAMKSYVKSPSTFAESVVSRSAFMRTRTTTQVMEITATIDQMLLNPSQYEKARSFAKKHGYFLQSAFQNVIDHVVWAGAYDQAIASGKSEDDAAFEADATIRQTQGSFNPEDVSRFEASSPFVRAFSMFYSYFNTIANLLETATMKQLSSDLGVKKKTANLFYIYVMGFAIPAVMSSLLAQLMSGRGIDDDDDGEYLDDLLVLFFSSQLKTLTAMVPVAGQVGQSFFNTLNDNKRDDSIRTSPIIGTIETAVRAPRSVYDAVVYDKDKKRAVSDTLTLLGIVSGLPLKPLAKPINYTMDRVERGSEDGPIETVRGLITGKPSRQ